VLIVKRNAGRISKEAKGMKKRDHPSTQKFAACSALCCRERLTRSRQPAAEPNEERTLRSVTGEASVLTGMVCWFINFSRTMSEVGTPTGSSGIIGAKALILHL
jgi:hypothetical protein